MPESIHCRRGGLGQAQPRHNHPGDHVGGRTRRTSFKATYGAKFSKAVAKITDDLEALLAFDDFPAEHWIHLRTRDESSTPAGGCRRWLPWIHVLPRPPGQREIAGPEPESRRDARSAARTALTPVRTAVKPCRGHRAAGQGLPTCSTFPPASPSRSSSPCSPSQSSPASAPPATKPATLPRPVGRRRSAVRATPR
jgi:hypothetical protein